MSTNKGTTIGIGTTLIILSFALIVSVYHSIPINDENKTDSKVGIKLISDLDINNYGFDGNNAFIEVVGKAGETFSENHKGAIAYVLNIRMENGEEQLWAVDSHEIQHGTVRIGEEWHGHRVLVENNCLNEVDEVTHATVKDSKVIFENMKRLLAAEILSASTVELEIQVDDPDNPPPGTECIAIVVKTFDTFLK